MDVQPIAEVGNRGVLGWIGYGSKVAKPSEGKIKKLYKDIDLMLSD